MLPLGAMLMFLASVTIYDPWGHIDAHEISGPITLEVMLMFLACGANKGCWCLCPSHSSAKGHIDVLGLYCPWRLVWMFEVNVVTSNHVEVHYMCSC